MTENTTFNGDDLRRDDLKFQPPRYQQHLRAAKSLDDLARERFGKRIITSRFAGCSTSPAWAPRCGARGGRST